MRSAAGVLDHRGLDGSGERYHRGMAWSGFALLAGFILFFLPGVILATLAVRGRAVRDEPRCAQCRQLVGVHQVVDQGRCPECGGALAEPGSVTFLRRRLRVGMLVLGLVSTLFSLAIPFAGVALVNMRAAGAAAAMPTAQTTAELIARIALPNTLLELQELERRATGAGLSDDEMKAIVNALMAVRDENDARRALPTGDAMIAMALKRGLLDDAMRAALLDARVNVEELVSIPMKVRAGSTISLFGGTSSPPLVRTLLIEEATIDGRTLAAQSFATGTNALPISLDRGGHLVFDAEPGARSLRLKVRRRIHHIPVGMTVDTATAPPVVERVDDVDVPVEILAKDAPTFIELERSPDLAASVRAATHVTCVSIDRDSRGPKCLLMVDGDVGYLDGRHLSYDIVVELDGREIVAGWVGRRQWAGGSSGTTSMAGVTLPECPEPIPSTVTVRLRPAPLHVETDPALTRRTGAKGPRAIVGEPVEFLNVPVRSNARPEAPAKAAPGQTP